MNKQPISPKAHALIDYSFAAALLILPYALNMNKENRAMFRKFAISTILYVGITDQPVSVKRLIPFPWHGVVDKGSLVYLLLKLLRKSLRQDKAALAVQLGFIGLGSINVFGTNFNANTK